MAAAEKSPFLVHSSRPFLNDMAKKCDLCKRGATKGASRSHSKIKTLKRQNINLQTKNVGDLKLKLCTSCMRTMAKNEK